MKGRLAECGVGAAGKRLCVGETIGGETQHQIEQSQRKRENDDNVWTNPARLHLISFTMYGRKEGGGGKRLD